MAVFSTNQTRQFYVVTKESYNDPNITLAGQGYFSGVNTDKDKYFKYVGADGTVMRSDLVKNVKYVSRAHAISMRRTTKAVGIKSEDDVAIGQPHLIKVTFKNFIGLSDEYTTSVMADFTPKTNSKELLYKNLAITLAKSLSKFVTPLADVYLLTSEIDSVASSGIAVTAATTLKDLEGNTVYGIAIVAAKQPHTVGTGTTDLVDFDVTLAPVTVNGMDAPWGEVITDFYDGYTVKNGEVVADMENFYMKERGDQYGNVGWPNVVPTMYLADPTKEYDIFDIQYAYIGSNESCQASEKTLTIAVESSLGTEIKNIHAKLGSLAEECGVPYFKAEV